MKPLQLRLERSINQPIIKTKAQPRAESVVAPDVDHGRPDPPLKRDQHFAFIKTRGKGQFDARPAGRGVFELLEMVHNARQEFHRSFALEKFQKVPNDQRMIFGRGGAGGRPKRLGIEAGG